MCFLFCLSLKGSSNLCSTTLTNGNLLSPATNSYILVNDASDTQNGRTQNQAMLKQMQKKYSKSVDCYHYLDPTNTNSASNMQNSTANLNSSNSNLLLSSSPQNNYFTTPSVADSTTVVKKQHDDSILNKTSAESNGTLTSSSNPTSTTTTNSTNSNTNSNTNTNSNIQLQRQYSQTSSPLIPRRNDYEPMTRVTIQRQQRVYDQSPTKTLATPITNFGRNVTDDAEDSNMSLYANGLTAQPSKIDSISAADFLKNSQNLSLKPTTVV